jgi:hypothetical protein
MDRLGDGLRGQWRECTVGEMDIAGRFRLAGEIGRGNMGEVHRAEDLQAPRACLES